MTTLKIGIASYEHFKQRSLSIARGDLKPDGDDPKVWFTSIESFARILSERNRELLKIISEVNPDSVTELAQKTGRAKSNLSRTLRTMERYGLVRFESGQGRMQAPRVVYSDITLNMSL
jgi:predicted transcriptional regulator